MFFLSVSKTAGMFVISFFECVLCDSSVSIDCVVRLHHCGLVDKFICQTLTIQWAGFALFSAIAPSWGSFSLRFLENLAIVFINFSFDIRHAPVRYLDGVAVHDFP